MDKNLKYKKGTSFILGVSGPGRKIICETCNSKINLGQTEDIKLEKETTSNLIMGTSGSGKCRLK